MFKLNTKYIPETLEECGGILGCRDCLYGTREEIFIDTVNKEILNCELSEYKAEILVKLASIFKEAEEVKYD